VLLRPTCQPLHPHRARPSPPLFVARSPAPTWHRADPPPFSLAALCPSAFKSAGRHPTLFSALFLHTRTQARRRFPRPPLTRSVSLGRRDRHGHRRVSNRHRRRPPPPPPTVRPSQSAAIFQFGAALTSLALPCSS
jgi:hypothetical protein